MEVVEALDLRGLRDHKDQLDRKVTKEKRDLKVHKELKATKETKAIKVNAENKVLRDRLFTPIILEMGILQTPKAYLAHKVPLVKMALMERTVMMEKMVLMEKMVRTALKVR